MRRRLRSYLPATLVALGGCYPSETFVEELCTSSTQCERGQGCRMSEGRCIEIPPNAVMGTFTCTVDDGSATELEIGGSDVTGNFDGIEVSLISGKGCTLHPDGSFEFALLGLRSRLTALGIQGPAPGRHSFSPFDFTSPNIAIYGPGGSGLTEAAAAFVSAGYFELDRSPVLGQPLTVYLEAYLEPASTTDVAGVGCELGQSVCGAWPFARTYCATLDDEPVCLADCTVPGDCAAYMADVCDDGLCLRSCATNADCDSPLECTALASGVSACL